MRELCMSHTQKHITHAHTHTTVRAYTQTHKHTHSESYDIHSHTHPHPHTRTLTHTHTVIDHGIASVEMLMEEALQDVSPLVKDIQERLRRTCTNTTHRAILPHATKWSQHCV